MRIVGLPHVNASQGWEDTAETTGSWTQQYGIDPRSGSTTGAERSAGKPGGPTTRFVRLLMWLPRHAPKLTVKDAAPPFAPRVTRTRSLLPPPDAALSGGIVLAASLSTADGNPIIEHGVGPWLMNLYEPMAPPCVESGGPPGGMVRST